MDESLYRNRPPRDEGTAGLSLWGVPGPASNGTETSDEARDSLTRETLNDGHRVILNTLWRRGPMTDEALQQATGLNPNAERPRRGELVAGGMVIDTGAVGLTASGRRAILWDLAPDTRRRANEGRKSREEAA